MRMNALCKPEEQAIMNSSRSRSRCTIGQRHRRRQRVGECRGYNSNRYTRLFPLLFTLAAMLQQFVPTLSEEYKTSSSSSSSSLLRGSSSSAATTTSNNNSNSNSNSKHHGHGKHPSNFLRWRNLSGEENDEANRVVTNEDFSNNTGTHVNFPPFQLQLSPIVAPLPLLNDETEMASHMETLRQLIEDHLNQTLSIISVFSTSEFDGNAGGEFAFATVNEVKFVNSVDIVPIMEEDEEGEDELVRRTRRRHLQNETDEENNEANDEAYNSIMTMTVEITGGQAFYLYGPGGLFMSAIPNPTLLEAMITESLELNELETAAAAAGGGATIIDEGNAQLLNNNSKGGVLAAKLRQSGGIIFDSVQSIQVMERSAIMPDVDVIQVVSSQEVVPDEYDDLSESVIELPLPTDEIEAAMIPTTTATSTATEASTATQATTVAVASTTTASTTAATTMASTTTQAATTQTTTTSSTKAIITQSANVVAQIEEEAEVVTVATTTPTPSTTQAITEVVVVEVDDIQDASKASSSSADKIKQDGPSNDGNSNSTGSNNISDPSSEGTVTNNPNRDEDEPINSISNSKTPLNTPPTSSSNSKSNNSKNIILAGSVSIVVALLVGAALFIQRKRRIRRNGSSSKGRGGEDHGTNSSSRSVRMTRLSDEDYDLEYNGFTNSIGIGNKEDDDVATTAAGGMMEYNNKEAGGVVRNTNKRAPSPAGIDSEQTSQVHNLTSRRCRVSNAGGMQQNDDDDDDDDYGANNIMNNNDEGNTVTVGDTSFEQGALQIIAPSALLPQATSADNVNGGDKQEEEKDEDFDKMLANAALASGAAAAAAAAATMSRSKSNNGPLAEDDSLKPAVDTSYGIDTTIASNDDFNADHHHHPLGKISQFDVIDDDSENRKEVVLLDDMGNPVTGTEDLVYDDIDEAMEIAARTTSRGGNTVPSPFDFNENDLFNNNAIDNSMGSHDILNDINQAAILHQRSGDDKVDKARGENTASPFSTTSSSYIGLLEDPKEEEVVTTQSLPAEDNEQTMKDNDSMASHDILDTINKVAQSSRMLRDDNGPLLGASPIITPSFRTNAISPSTIQRDPPGTPALSDPPGDNATLISDDDDHDENDHSDDETDLFAELRTVDSATDAYTGTIETSAFTGMDTALVEEFEKNEITSSYGASGPLCAFQARSFACKMEKKDDDGAQRTLSLSGAIKQSWDRISSKSPLPPQFEATIVSDDEGSDSSDDGNNISRPWKDKWDDPFTLSNTKQAANARMITPAFHNAKDTSLSDLEGESNYGTDSDWDVDDTEMDDFELRGHGEDDFEASTVGEKNAPMRIW